MAHFAKVKYGVVTDVIVADKDFIDSLPVEPDAQWIQTSYNTRKGVHVKGKSPVRKNFAGVGYAYDSDRDAFIPPKPFQSWKLCEESCVYMPPVECPGEGYFWNEETLSWEQG